jgi:Adenylate and Guanylate cyclase catalytic domain
VCIKSQTAVLYRLDGPEIDRQSRYIDYDENYHNTIPSSQRFPEIAFPRTKSILRNSFVPSTRPPYLFSWIIACIFVMLGMSFFTFVYFIEKHHIKLFGEAAISNAIVSSVSQCLWQLGEIRQQNSWSFMSCSILDAGFTAWSSARQPVEVTMLLETLCRAFDAIAAMRKVFKVETIGGKHASDELEPCFRLRATLSCVLSTHLSCN